MRSRWALATYAILRAIGSHVGGNSTNDDLAGDSPVNRMIMRKRDGWGTWPGPAMRWL